MLDSCRVTLSPRGGIVEQGAQGRDAAPAGVAGDEVAPRERVGEAEHPRFVQRPVQAAARDHRGEARDRRDLPVEQPSEQFDPTIGLECTLDLHPARVASPV
ncbi:MAG: hypothetical protein M3P50_07395 [Actinomycetota bacterium]|nr:hypothetical protein [Actinomycetota bacterium]